jgi:NAD+ kinase
MPPTHPETSLPASTEPSTPRPEYPRALRAFVITHGRAETVGDGLRRLAAVAATQNVELVVPEIEARKHPVDLSGATWSTGEAQDADIVVVLGGDGTVLRALHEVIGTTTPVLAINYGRVGFLTTASVDRLEYAATCAFTGAYQVVDLPTVELIRTGERVGIAANDVVVTSALHGRMAHVRWWVNDVALGEVGCDGVVVATPAGSTAYSLSAGGPVMNWGLEGFCVTFVAPHSLAARSLVLGGGHRVVIENASVDVDARLILDGQVQRQALGPGERIEAALAPEFAHLALLEGVSFLQRFRDTFGR